MTAVITAISMFSTAVTTAEVSGYTLKCRFRCAKVKGPISAAEETANDREIFYCSNDQPFFVRDEFVLQFPSRPRSLAIFTLTNAKVPSFLRERGVAFRGKSKGNVDSR